MVEIPIFFVKWKFFLEEKFPFLREILAAKLIKIHQSFTSQSFSAMDGGSGISDFLFAITREKLVEVELQPASL